MLYSEVYAKMSTPNKDMDDNGLNDCDMYSQDEDSQVFSTTPEQPEAKERKERRPRGRPPKEKKMTAAASAVAAGGRRSMSLDPRGTLRTRPRSSSCITCVKALEEDNASNVKCAWGTAAINAAKYQRSSSSS